MRRRRQTPFRTLMLTAVLLGGLPACTWWTSGENVLVSSEPLGARILIDGQDTGATTPAQLPIGGNFGSDHLIVLEKPGYRPAVRRVYQHTEGYTAQWIDGTGFDMGMVPLPIFWTPGDFVFPFGVRGALLPAELYVQLERDDAPLLGFDLLAARAQQAKEEAQRGGGGGGNQTP